MKNKNQTADEFLSIAKKNNVAYKPGMKRGDKRKEEEENIFFYFSFLYLTFFLFFFLSASFSFLCPFFMWNRRKGKKHEKKKLKKLQEKKEGMEKRKIKSSFSLFFLIWLSGKYFSSEKEFEYFLRFCFVYWTNEEIKKGVENLLKSANEVIKKTSKKHQTKEKK